MSRTYRNKNTVPKDWTVRDDGYPYYNGDDKFGEEHLKLPLPHPDWNCYLSKPEPRFRSRWMSKETAITRYYQERTYRAKIRHLIHHERYDDIVDPTGTCGWDSW